MKHKSRDVNDIFELSKYRIKLSLEKLSYRQKYRGKKNDIFDENIVIKTIVQNYLSFFDSKRI